MTSNDQIQNFRKEDWLKNSATCIKCRNNYEAEAAGLGKKYIYNPSPEYVESEFTYIIDISLAYKTVDEKNKTATFNDNKDDLKKLIAQNEIFVEHINHFTTNDPGILITFEFNRKGNSVKEKVMVLAEGNHRAAFSSKHNVPYWFYYFDVNETADILTRQPK